MPFDLPSDFLAYLQAELDEQTLQLLKESLETESPTSIRYNPLKHHDKVTNSVVPWEPFAQYLETRPSFILDPAWHSGAYYVQEASSMIIPYMLQHVNAFKEKIWVLDACAAPGGKSTHILSHIKASSLLFANETVRNRANILQENVERWGDDRVCITNNEVGHYPSNQFDIILLDAPCSGEGMFRKDPQSRSEWSLKNVDLCAQRQSILLAQAARILKPGGLLVYSTCTFNHQENLDNVRLATETLGLSCVAIDLPASFGFEQLKEEGIEAYQAWPHRVKGEGFFVCMMKKTADAKTPLDQLSTKSAAKEGWFKQPDKNDLSIIQAFIPNADSNRLFMMRAKIYMLPECLSFKQMAMLPSLNYLSIGTELGEIKGKDFIPAHALAMHASLKTSAADWEMREKEALSFLRKENIVAPSNLHNGWCRACYQGNGLGWLKIIPGRINNYLPSSLRVLKK